MKKLILFVFLLSISASPAMAVSIKKPRLLPALNHASERVASQTGELKGRVEQKREQVETRTEQMAQNRDEKKLQIAEHISGRLENINQRATTALGQVVERISQLLGKLTTRLEKLASEGMVTSEAEATVAEAKVALATVKTDIEIQAIKVYELNLEDETALKVGASTAKETLKADLSDLRDRVHSVKELVHEVISLIKEVQPKADN